MVRLLTLTNKEMYMQQDDRASEFHKRSGNSHEEARKLLTGMAVGSLGVLYATLTGKEAPVLNAYSRWLALAAVVSMALSAGFGIVAWRADAAWAYNAAKNFENDPSLTTPDGGRWHDLKKWCDWLQVGAFGFGLGMAALLTLYLL
jgi:hypothetical protein